MSFPLLEYCCQLDNPRKTKDIQALEAIQLTFTYKITEVQHLNYWERIQARTQIVLSPETPWTLYNNSYLEDNTAYVVPNIDGRMGHTIKTRKRPRHGPQCVTQYPTTLKRRRERYIIIHIWKITQHIWCQIFMAEWGTQ